MMSCWTEPRLSPEPQHSRLWPCQHPGASESKVPRSQGVASRAWHPHTPFPHPTHNRAQKWTLTEVLISEGYILKNLNPLPFLPWLQVLPESVEALRPKYYSQKPRIRKICEIAGGGSLVLAAVWSKSDCLLAVIPNSIAFPGFQIWALSSHLEEAFYWPSWCPGLASPDKHPRWVPGQEKRAELPYSSVDRMP